MESSIIIWIRKNKTYLFTREHFPLKKIVLAAVGLESEYATLTLFIKALLAEVDV